MTINSDLKAGPSNEIVLSILVDAESYGFAILQRVRELSSEATDWSDGMLYPVLHRLERVSLIEAQWRVVENGRRRKYYRITPHGRRHMKRRQQPARAHRR